MPKKKKKMEYQAYSDVADSPSKASQQRRDPFYVVKEKVQIRAGELKDSYEQWKDLLENTNTSTNPQFTKLMSEVKMTAKSVRIDLNDLQKTINIVESKRSRFKDINDEELDSRKSFVNDMKAVVQTYEEALNSARTMQKIKSDQRSSNRSELFSGVDTNSVNLHVGGGGGGGMDYRAKQQMMEEQQDKVLDDMTGALDRLGDVGNTINVELVSQNRMIGEMDEEMELGMGQMAQVMGKIEKVLGTSNKCKLWCIFFLALLAAILLFCVIYT